MARKKSDGIDETVTRRIAGRGSAARPGAKTAGRRPAAKKKTSATKARARKAAPNVVEDDGPPPPAGSTSLVVVESPAKAKTIGKYLGRGYRVKATIGHVRDLPEKKLGIDIEKGFEPEYVAIAGTEKTLAELKSAAHDSKESFLATDPDREGEAIAWHVAEQIKRRGGAPVRRVLFHEITKDAVQRALASAGQIDEKKVEAQQARRVLDRIVGYKASPILWKTVKKGISAGRVQTVALRLIVEREREIRAFTPVEYWTIEAQLQKGEQRFTGRLHHVDGKKPEIGKEADAREIVSEVERVAAAVAGAGTGNGERGTVGAFPVTDVKRRERRKNPSPPFTTSTLQQEAAKKLGFGSKRTMRLAQDLYEGIDIGPDGAVGLITYMRADSLASGPMFYGAGRNAQNAQDAHEGIRPTDPSRRPELVRRYLKEDQFKLYQLVWQRFMASQMAPAVFDTTTVDYDLAQAVVAVKTTHGYLFRSTGSVIKFPGFLALYREAHEEGEHRALEDEQALPSLEKGERVPVREIVPSQHFTEPPPRYSEASLVKELERLGIGRPSTYAQIISTLVDRHYTQLEQRRFFPTALGESVERVMVKQFPDIFNVRFTSDMEGELDKIEDGAMPWRRVLNEFYRPFEKSLNSVQVESLIAEAHDLSALATERCPNCGGKLMAKGGFFGPFVACENHPKTCKFTRPLKGDRKPAEPTEYTCHECGAMMLKRHGRSGFFLGCSRFPKCRGTRSMPTGVICPKDGGEIAERRSKKRGKAFYGCSNYPNCDFVCWDKPVPEQCPECGYLGAEMKSNKTRGEFRKCVKCANEWDIARQEPEEAVAV